MAYMCSHWHVILHQGCPQDVKSQRARRDRDVPKDISRPQCRSSKTLTCEVCHLTTCFLRVRSIIFLLTISASMHCMDVHKTSSHETPRPRPRRYIFKTETFDFPNSQYRLETETFKTETTSPFCIASACQIL